MPTTIMQIISSQSYETKPWKNGGGITHEIMAFPSADGFHWRLSVAEVGCDGPFSCFAGMSRILTVIEGHGLSLVSQADTLQADIFAPVAFSGELPISGVLRDGPIRDLNLIYDPRHVSGRVSVLSGAGRVDLAAQDQTSILFAAQSAVMVAGAKIAQGGCAIWTNETISVRIEDGGVAILVSVQTNG